ncbi:hypothetical protein CBR_g55296 [Chara braunii]|uniref:SMP-30/Gluconolactonase/LRE-like region domain-containing protein n=1 Tax=Chara braunii TaxID=69332 RepID=A0A388MD48_CHABU|nr:hypothetical protein CBR_g55296 [Chara braunii]|eukprot:GBG92389.1 hypothetical protein CBR_g55296 [Chara braunii]
MKKVKVSQVLAVSLLLQVVVCCARPYSVDGRGAGRETSRSERLRYGKRAALRGGDGRGGWSVREFRERGLQGVLGAAESECPPLNNPFLLTACRTVVEHQPDPLFQDSPFGTDNCVVVIQNIVYAADGMQFYYILQQECLGPDGQFSKKSLSYMEANLTSVSGLATTRVLSHWWPAQSPNGAPPENNTLFLPNQGMPFMAEATGTEMSKMGTHLLLTTLSAGPSDLSWVVLLSIADGSRLSLPIQAELAAGLTFNPEKTKLYVTDVYDPSEILVAPVIAPDVPTRLGMNRAVQFGPLTGTNMSQPVIGPYSFSADGSCLYFVDQVYDRLWTFAPLSNEVKPIAVSSDDTSVPFGSNVVNVSMGGHPSDLAVTSDGLNVFFTTLWGELYHLTMSAPCGTPSDVEKLAEHDTAGFRGLALNEAEGKLLVGTTHGLIFEFTTSLPPPSTAPFTSLPPPSTAPLTSRPPPSTAPLTSRPPPSAAPLRSRPPPSTTSSRPHTSRSNAAPRPPTSRPPVAAPPSSSQAQTTTPSSLSGGLR